MNNTNDKSLYTVQIEVNAREREIISRRLGRAVGCVPPAEIEMFLREALYTRLAALSGTTLARRHPLDVAAEIKRGEEHGVGAGERIYRTLREQIALAVESDEIDRRLLVEGLLVTIAEITEHDAILADVLLDHVIALLDDLEDMQHVGLLCETARLRRKIEERRDLTVQPCPLVPPAKYGRTRDESAYDLFARALAAVPSSEDFPLDAYALLALARAAEDIDPPLAAGLYDNYVAALIADADAEIREAERAAVERADWHSDRYRLLLLEEAARNMHGLGRTERAVQCFEAGRRIVEAYEYEAYEEGGYNDLLKLVRGAPPEVRDGCAGMLAEITARMAEREQHFADEDERAREEERERQRRFEHEMARLRHEAGDADYDEADYSGINNLAGSA